MTIQFNLQNILDELDITSHYLAVETKSRPATMLQFAKGQSKRLDLQMLDDMLDEINRIAIEKNLNKTYTLDDILSYSYKK